jgi:hypothetical protein
LSLGIGIMRYQEPKNTKEIYWTKHIKEKMRYYGLAEGRLRRILKSPQRREKGIASGTIALMQPAGTKRPSEIWLMYQQAGQKKKMISAWRYPGISPKGEPIPIPEDILEELRKDKKIFPFP